MEIFALLLMASGAALMISRRRQAAPADIPSRAVYTEIVDDPAPNADPGKSSPSPAGPVDTGPGINETEQIYLARTIYGEARGEPERGQVAVAHVILNRVRHRQWPNTIKGVVTQGGGDQFNVWRASDPSYKAMMAADENDAAFRLALKIAYEAMTGISAYREDCYIYFNPATSTNTGFVNRVRELRAGSETIGQHEFSFGVT